MSGASGGVQGRLMAENPKATYVHCNSHVLNLCIVQACSLPVVKNMNSAVTETAYFFNNSPKRQLFLEKVIDKNTITVKVKDLCRTVEEAAEVGVEPEVPRIVARQTQRDNIPLQKNTTGG